MTIVCEEKGDSILDISYFTADSSPYGTTYGSWTTKWWQWILSTPKSRNPIVDGSGQYASINQPSMDVWFMAGKLGDENRKLPNRFCAIPYGRSILFPVINCEANPVEYPELRTDQDIIEHVKKDEDSIIKKECYVDGKSIPAQRVKSDPIIFELNMVDHNLFTEKGGSTYASADGYWVFMKPPPKGEHTVSFQGQCEYGRLCSGANYIINITEKGHG
jgi:hypothetical protein